MFLIELKETLFVLYVKKLTVIYVTFIFFNSVNVLRANMKFMSKWKMVLKWAESAATGQAVTVAVVWRMEVEDAGWSK